MSCTLGVQRSPALTKLKGDIRSQLRVLSKRSASVVALRYTRRRLTGPQSRVVGAVRACRLVASSRVVDEPRRARLKCPGRSPCARSGMSEILRQHDRAIS